MKDDAMPFVDPANEVARLRSKHPFHRSGFQSDNMDLDVARAQRGRSFQPNEARANNDRAARALRGCNERPTVG
jgi:hypothetical protein